MLNSAPIRKLHKRRIALDNSTFHSLNPKKFRRRFSN